MKALIVAALAALAAQAAPAQTVNARNPQALAKVIAEMGYPASAVETGTGAPIFTADIDNFKTAFAFGDCDAATNCNYLLLVASFSDVVDPPHDWINAVNADLDLGKVWLNDDKTISFSMPMQMGNAEMMKETLRYALEQWLGIVGYISNSATENDLAK